MSVQITLGQRYEIAALRRQRLSVRAIERTNGRRSRSRRGQRFTEDDWVLVEHLLSLDWSPEHISGRLALEGLLSISHETVYLYVWADKRSGGESWHHLRQRSKKRRKRCWSHDSRGRLAGTRHMSERPPEIESREEAGHFEVDTIKGDSQGMHTVITLVERKTGYLTMGKLERHTAADCTAKSIETIKGQGGRVKTITADNRSEFHGYKDVEAATGVVFYFATPHHSWERGTNENTNGSVRQYLPKRTNTAHVTQADCDEIATHLNRRPRKRLGYRTPEACYVSAR
ncbi:MAG: IS30 family transposase [Coriobacteriales bacterium]